jgi:hypothetical protein
VWENRYAVMSDAAVLSYESLSAAARLTKRLLMVHSDQCALPDTARRQFAVVPTDDKRLDWDGQTRHLQYYVDPGVIDHTTWSIVDWFARALGRRTNRLNEVVVGSAWRPRWRLLSGAGEVAGESALRCMIERSPPFSWARR